jgi:hypothetical protein
MEANEEKFKVIRWIKHKKKGTRRRFRRLSNL